MVEKYNNLSTINYVGKFLQGGGEGDYIVWVGNVGPFGVIGKYDRGDTHGVPANDHRE